MPEGKDGSAKLLYRRFSGRKKEKGLLYLGKARSGRIGKMAFIRFNDLNHNLIPFILFFDESIYTIREAVLVVQF